MTVTDLRLEAVVEILDRLASAVERVAPDDAAVRAGRLRADSLAAVDRVQQEIETFSPVRRDWYEEHNRTLEGTDGLCPECEARSKERREQAAGDDAVDPAVETDPPWLAGAIEHCLGSNMDFVRSLRYCLALADANRSQALDRALPKVVRDDNYHAGELAERACWIIRRRDGELVHEEALKRIEMLMDAERDTRAGEELDLLTTLVQFYERKPESEMMPHSDIGQPTAGLDNATAPVMGADPPWFKEQAETIMHDAHEACGVYHTTAKGQIIRALHRAFEYGKRFASDQPPSSDQVMTALSVFLQRLGHYSTVVDPAGIEAMRAALIAAAKAKSGG